VILELEKYGRINWMKMNQSQGRSLNETFNDFVRMRGNRAVSSGSSPDDLDAHLSYEQRQTKEDLLKIAHHNPEEVLAGRIAPLNIETKKLSNIVRKQKEHVNRLLLHIQIEQIRSYFAAMQSQIQEILDHLRELRLALLKAIQANTDLLDLVETALQDKQIGRADGGTFINQALQHMTQAYMERHDIPPEAMRDFTDEQMLAMVEEQSEQVTAMNITMSDQIGVIDQNHPFRTYNPKRRNARFRCAG